MSESIETPIQFIRDEPAEDDFFNSHSQLATAIQKAIVNNPNLRTIGILGPWGSGKSTVIYHLKQKLEADEKNLVFTYDAWVHQSEPVRRSFLERLIRFLISRKLTTELTWKADLDELNGKVVQTETTPIPSLTKNAAWLLFAALLVPVGVSLIDLDVIKDAFGAERNLAGEWTLRIGLLLIAAPVITLLLRYIVTRPYLSAENWRHFLRWNQTGEARDDLSTIFLARSVETTRSITSQSPEPTAIEFAKAFRKVMNLVEHKSNKLIFVIDNLDRVLVSDALQIWSTIRSFFLTPALEEDHEIQFSHPLVVLPIDDSAIERMFEGDQSPELGVSFLNKTFDVTFRIAPPVMSDWRNFLRKQLVFALGTRANNSLIYWTNIFFEHWMVERGGSVTPREINKFVNSLAALALQWEAENIPLETLAFYTAAQTTISEDVLRFVRSAETVVPPSANWPREVAALHFGVPLEKASQVLLTEEIEKAIIGNDEGVFREISKIPGFYDTLGNVLQMLGEISERGEEPTVASNAALLLSSNLPQDEAWESEAWNSIVRTYQDTLRKGFGSSDPDKRVAVFFPFLSTINRQKFYDAVISTIGRELVSANADRARALGMLLLQLQDDRKRHDFDDFEVTITDDSAAVAFDVLLRVSVVPKAVSFVRSHADHDDIKALIIEMLSSEKTAVSGARAVSLLMHADGRHFLQESDEAWESLASDCLTLVRQQAGNPALADPILETICHLVPNVPAARNGVKALADEGVLTARMESAFETGKVNTLRDALALMIVAQHSFPAPGQRTWNRVLEKFPNLPKDVLHRLRALDGQAAIHAVWDAYYEVGYVTRPFLEEIINYAVKAKDLGRLKIKDILNNISRYKYPISWRLEGDFLDQLQDYTNFWDNFDALELDKSAESIAEIAVKRTPKRAGKIQSALRDKIQAVGQADWQNAINTGKKPYDVALALAAEHSFMFGKSSALYKALAVSTSNVVIGQPEHASRWVKMTGLLSEKAKRAAFRVLSDSILAGQSDRHILALVKTGGKELLQFGDFDAKPDAALDKLFFPLVENAKGREWLKDHSKEIRTWVKKSTAAQQSKVETCLAKFLQSSNANRRYWAQLMQSEIMP